MHAGKRGIIVSKSNKRYIKRMAELAELTQDRITNEYIRGTAQVEWFGEIVRKAGRGGLGKCRERVQSISREQC